MEQSTYHSPCSFFLFIFFCRTYADKLSPKVVQSLLDLLCSQLKNLLSQAGVSLLSSAKDQEDNKQEDSVDSEKKDFRGSKGIWPQYMFQCSRFDVSNCVQDRFKSTICLKQLVSESATKPCSIHQAVV